MAAGAIALVGVVVAGEWMEGVVSLVVYPLLGRFLWTRTLRERFLRAFREATPLPDHMDVEGAEWTLRRRLPLVLAGMLVAAGVVVILDRDNPNFGVVGGTFLAIGPVPSYPLVAGS